MKIVCSNTRQSALKKKNVLLCLILCYVSLMYHVSLRMHCALVMRFCNLRIKIAITCNVFEITFHFKVWRFVTARVTLAMHQSLTFM